jgi:hypothetical protein
MLLRGWKNTKGIQTLCCNHWEKPNPLYFNCIIKAVCCSSNVSSVTHISKAYYHVTIDGVLDWVLDLLTT